MGLEPAFSLTANNKIITAALSERLMRLHVSSESDHQTDELELTLWDTDIHAPLAKPKIGTILELSLGYVGSLVKMGVFVVSSLSGEGGKTQPRTMTIRARAAPYADTPKGASNLQTQRTRSWVKGTTIGDLVQKIARDHGLVAGVSPSLEKIHLQHLDQTDESDISFLQKLAKHFDAIAKPAGGKLLFLSRGMSESSSGKQIPLIPLTASEVSRWSWDEDKHMAPGTVVGMYHAIRTATMHAVSIGQGDPVTRLRRRFRTLEDAQAAAQAEMNRRARGSIQLNLSLMGNPSLNAGGSVKLDQSFGQGIEGVWIVKSASHSLDKIQGFQTQIACEKANSDPDIQHYITAKTTDTALKKVS